MSPFLFTIQFHLFLAQRKSRTVFETESPRGGLGTLIKRVEVLVDEKEEKRKRKMREKERERERERNDRR